MLWLDDSIKGNQKQKFSSVHNIFFNRSKILIEFCGDRHKWCTTRKKKTNYLKKLLF
uniref:Uncharacterized protein n=1 Tax=Anguilla anguilla TaxID=7936 RepID=A0A0E9P774_ANGAN